MGSRKIDQVIHRHSICGRVVFGGKKPGVLWDDQAMIAQNFPNLWIIGHGCKDTSIRVTMTTSTCTTIQRRIIRIVFGLASMTADHYKPAKVFREADHSQSPLHKGRLLQWGKTECQWAQPWISLLVFMWSFNGNLRSYSAPQPLLQRLLDGTKGCSK